MSLGLHFSILLCQTNRQDLVRWTVTAAQEVRRPETVPVELLWWVAIVWTISVKFCCVSTLRKLPFQSGTSYGSAQEATNSLKLHPYHARVMHRTKGPDKEKRLRYCRWFAHFIREVQTFWVVFSIVLRFQDLTAVHVRGIKTKIELCLPNIAAGTVHRVASQTQRTFPAPNTTLFFFVLWCQCNYLFDKERVRNGMRNFRSPYTVLDFNYARACHIFKYLHLLCNLMFELKGGLLEEGSAKGAEDRCGREMLRK
jgi:hypothetical protein